ncbi:MAG: NUDIX domain-containing protein [Bacteroidota bacterium]
MAKIYRQAVMAVIVNHQQRILFGYSPRDKSYKFPQGGLEKGEDIITGIRRELLEELDYILYQENILKIYSEKIRYSFPPDVHPVYMGQELSIVKIKHIPKLNVIPQDDEFDRVFWIDPAEITNYNSEYRAKAYFRAMEICGLV